MSSKTLEKLVKDSDHSAKPPLEFWKQLQRSSAEVRPSAAALARRASRDVDMCAAGR